MGSFMKIVSFQQLPQVLPPPGQAHPHRAWAEGEEPRDLLGGQFFKVEQVEGDPQPSGREERADQSPVCSGVWNCTGASARSERGTTRLRQGEEVTGG